MPRDHCVATIKHLVDAVRKDKRFIVEKERLVDGKVTRVRVPKRIVLLIDDFDKPITAALSCGLPERAVIDRAAVLSGFFSVVKAMAADFHLVFVTGVSQASYERVLSSAGNFTSLITTHPEFADSLFCLGDAEIRETYGRYIAESYREQPWLQHSVSEASAAGESRDAAVVDAVMEKFRVLFGGYRLHPLGAPVFNTASLIASLREKGFAQGWAEAPVHQQMQTAVVTTLTVGEIDGLLDGNVFTRWTDLTEGPWTFTMNHLHYGLQYAFQTGLATIKGTPRRHPGGSRYDFDVVVGAPNLEAESLLVDRKLRLLLRDDAHRFRTALRELAEALLDGRHATAAAAMAEVLAVATTHALLESDEELSGVLAGNLRRAVLHRPMAFVSGRAAAAAPGHRSATGATAASASAASSQWSWSWTRRNAKLGSFGARVDTEGR